MEPELLRPLPKPMTPEAKPYWDGLREGKLMLPECNDCGKAFFYPRIACPHCHSRNVGWMQASGKGKLYSFQIAYRALNPAFKIPPPYVLAMVELEEGPRLMSNLINVEADPEVIKCDMAVEVVFEKQTDEVTIPLFQPAS
ncbi:MAG: Zn-ribbon domain-containing OB-fold protein [Alphaproteobacteria bacterium]